jgi:hypothetical protein
MTISPQKVLIGHDKIEMAQWHKSLMASVPSLHVLVMPVLERVWLVRQVGTVVKLSQIPHSWVRLQYSKAVYMCMLQGS